MEMLIVIAIVAVLISVAVPVLSSQLERSREAVDLANVRSAYAQVSTEALLGNTGVPVTVKLKQKQDDWQSRDPITTSAASSIPMATKTRITGRVMPRRTEAAWSPMTRPTVWCSHGAERQRRSSPTVCLIPV